MIDKNFSDDFLNGDVVPFGTGFLPNTMCKIIPSGSEGFRFSQKSTKFMWPDLQMVELLCNSFQDCSEFRPTAEVERTRIRILLVKQFSVFAT